ncbi:MAG: TIM44-like domain-containing protein [Methylobacteriaceae bacterium]|nr:TIM44-like domain-containing protein [Methylobacteriaceae bacterium]
MSVRRAFMIAFAIAALALALPTDAFARAGGGFSFGSRGSRTFMAPPVTSTAPRPAAPIERPGAFNQGYGWSAPQPSGGFFSGGFGRGLIGGLLGAGLFGLLFGNGLFGGLGSGISLIGLLIQFGLLFLLVRWVMGFIRGRQQPAFWRTAGSGGGSFLGGGAANRESFARTPSATSPLQLAPSDFDAFQQLLGEVQAAYGAEDTAGLRRLASPQMVAHFAAEISENARRGVTNRLSDVTLLQGDLAEAWREGGSDFATVAMRFSLVDTMVERSTGRLVAGNPSTPQEVTEVWTFARPAGSGPSEWRLSAIQQA